MKIICGTVSTDLGDIDAHVGIDGDLRWVEEARLNGVVRDLGEIGLRNGNGWISLEDHIIDTLTCNWSD